MKQIIRDSLILFLITLVAGLLLAVVNEKTKGPIADSKEKAKQAACFAVFEKADHFELIDIGQNVTEDGVSIEEAYKAVDAEGNELGTVLSVTTHEGYGGDINFCMGIDKLRTITGITILSSNETVGLGLEAENVLCPQFKGKNCVSYTYTKTGSTDPAVVDAISSATITTKAFTHGVNAGLAYYDKNLAKGGAMNE